MVDRAVIKRKFELLAATMSERGRRLWAGAEADAVGYGGVAAVASATGMAISTVRKGRDEVRGGAKPEDVVRDRRPGGGRRRVEEKDPGLRPALEGLVDPTTRGDPESPLRWTCKSTRTLARLLTETGHPATPQKVGELLHEGGYSLQANVKVKEGVDHPDRNAQFEWINARTEDCLAHGVPVISVDTKKKELVGDYANRGREWHPKGKAVEVLTYDFPDPKLSKAIPYGVYDVASNTALVNVGIDHDTPHFAVRSVEKWWEQMGHVRYPTAKELFITADAGGSNSYRSRVWKTELQSFADRNDLTVHVSHFPPGTSKWNKIEHRLFSFITMNWRGRPLTTYETIVELIASTTTAKGLEVTAALDRRNYPLNVEVQPHVWSRLALVPAAFHGEWNYTLRPRTPAELAAAEVVAAEVATENAAATHFIATQLAISKAPRPRDHATRLMKVQLFRPPTLAPPPSKRPRLGAQHWEALVRKQIESGLISSDFCRREGITSYFTFVHWRRRITGQIRPRRRSTK